ncbi:MAG: malonic semialdehyde reductase [Frankia sp.]
MATRTDHIVLDRAARALLFTEARTANTFGDEPVSRDQLRAITELAKWPPTSANTNPLRISFLISPEAKARLLPLMYAGNRDRTASAPAVALLAVDLDFHDKIPRLLPFRPQMRDTYKDDLALREQVATFNGALQAGYFILGVRAAGLAAKPMIGVDADGVDAEFFPGRPYKSILVVNIGKPGKDPWFDRLPRLDHDQYVDYL